MVSGCVVGFCERDGGGGLTDCGQGGVIIVHGLFLGVCSIPLGVISDVRVVYAITLGVIDSLKTSIATTIVTAASIVGAGTKGQDGEDNLRRRRRERILE
jgi:hypothetical protein